MESILARALEYTLKYWLKSFSRDQFKLQGRTVQLSNLDINGDALHASLGLPPALNVTTARVGKLEIVLPSVSYVQVEPIVVQIDRLDLVLKENDDVDACANTSSKESSPSSGKGSGYGFADKIADGMTLEVRTVNILVETHGGSRQRAGATWASPMASITIRSLFLYTTNENWQVVNLKEARDFSSDKKFIYVFKKLEWESLSIDLLPHPDMFAAADAHFASFQEGSCKKDDDGAKRVFFGGERFIEGISGQAYITIQRTALNSPLGLEVQLHITEVVCPALSEPGLRALLRFFMGFYVCLNRGDVNPNAQQRSTEAAGRSLVSIIVDHIFLGIKDVEFRLELLMQSLSFSRASVSDGENTRHLTSVRIGGLFLRDTFSRPPCTLVQPSTEVAPESSQYIPGFAESFCPSIYPLEDKIWQFNEGVPLVCLYSLQVQPSPAPPSFASETVINCQPLMIHLQEESCLKIISLLADGTAISPGAILPDSSVKSLKLNLIGLDITVPVDLGIPAGMTNGSTESRSSFTGATVHIENLSFSESPSLKLKLLNLDKDPACFCLWEDQPIDASQKKWAANASLLSLSLDTCNNSSGLLKPTTLWRCAELKEACVEVAMATADGSPLVHIPPPGGLVRIGVACQHYLSNTSVEQLFFILDLYAYFGRVSEKMAVIGTSRQLNKISREPSGSLLEKVPSDTAVSLAVNDLLLKFLETSSTNMRGSPLAQFHGENLFIKVSHRTLGGALAISSSFIWESVEVECTDTEGGLALENGVPFSSVRNGASDNENKGPQLKTVFWVQKKVRCQANGRKTTVPFLDISMVQVIPYNVQDLECHSLRLTACIAGVRLGGGMSYAEVLLHRFGILGPDGGPGKGLTKGLKNLSAGPLSNLFKPTPLIADEIHVTSDDGNSGNENLTSFHLGKPDDVDLSIEFKDWLFALEGVQETSFNEEGLWLHNYRELGREERSWHTTFQSLLVKAKSSRKDLANHQEISARPHKLPVELLIVGIEGLQILKPYLQNCNFQDGTSQKVPKADHEIYGGINMEASIILSEDLEDEMKWEVENLKFSVKQPIEIVVRKEELHHLASLCKDEVDSMGRIAAGILRILKLEGSVGRAAINQLNNLGTESFDKIFSPEKLSRGGSVNSIGFSPSFLNVTTESPQASLALTVAELEGVVLDSQAKCSALTAQVCNLKLPLHNISEFKELSQKLEVLQSLLEQLRTQI